jgi:hypothetical protein
VDVAAGVGLAVDGTTTCDGVAVGGGVDPWHERRTVTTTARRANGLIEEQSYHRDAPADRCYAPGKWQAAQ